ncbi:MAG: hypothetical protein EOP61_23815 [Sphingomonadales bacterium]|nr:MAG: hypothetical protein EOP61_23815 [Sphingomonadales bacterium]
MALPAFFAGVAFAPETFRALVISAVVTIVAIVLVARIVALVGIAFLIAAILAVEPVVLAPLPLFLAVSAEELRDQRAEETCQR